MMTGFDPFASLPLVDPPRPSPPYQAPAQRGVRVINGRGRTGPAPGLPSIDPALTFKRPVASATWTIPHTLGRLPGVTVYDADGALMIAEVYATEEHVVVVHAQPATGTVVLT